MQLDLAGDEGGAVMELAPGVRVPADAVRMQASRSGGPGGQNVNKLNTKLELWLRIDRLRGFGADAQARLRELAGRRLTSADEVHLWSQSGRSREANRRLVLRRLAAMLQKAARAPKLRRKTRPTKTSQLKRLQQKRRRAKVKQQRRGMG